MERKQREKGIRKVDNLTELTEKHFSLTNQEAAELYGLQDENLRFLENHLGAKIVARGGDIHLTGTEQEVEFAGAVLQQLIDLIKKGNAISIPGINYCIQAVLEGQGEQLSEMLNQVIQVTARGKQIKPKTVGQYHYVQAIRKNDITFGIGPAGTGKTYLAVVMAVSALKKKEVNRIVLTRPAVEAGEKLGFLPGDMQEKVNPYLRPLYDGLYDILGIETAQRYMDRSVIEVAPLAYMRGRTLDDSFIILDEAQNTTPEQMKMFLTRLGFGSKAVVTGDVTQVDLPRNSNSGLVVVQNILKGLEGISFQYLTQADVIRHPVVQRIVLAYEKYQEAEENNSNNS
ncbi:MAG TPA: PhoH family protein [Peptococcaceae bacterium]|jgi:phosphate starvation-inducible PhoH-like protein|nr:PhoH family protein [Clostridia bacterium]HOB82300.1 PhoH family protein [Peptococcaceae bacterium]HPZ70692.1 PhoH family protein [Peptococcaceae bacterium]HQD54074.1 PhoH family protein [Peptococcaceae bacterium]